jgi:hypothetical protein
MEHAIGELLMCILIGVGITFLVNYLCKGRFKSITAMRVGETPRVRRIGSRDLIRYGVLLVGTFYIVGCNKGLSPNEVENSKPSPEAKQSPDAEITQTMQSMNDQPTPLPVASIASTEAKAAVEVTQATPVPQTAAPATPTVQLSASDLRKQLTKQFPLSPVITANGVAIAGRRDVVVERGVVRSLALGSAGGLRTCEEICLYNPTEDKVKPDVQVLIMNGDGVIICTHSENWLLSTLKPNESYTVRVRKPMEYPRSLIFSKWAYLGWDMTPAYALCVGSKASYDQLKNDCLHEAERLRANVSSNLDLPYEIKDILPEVQPFSFEVAIPISRSQIVESVIFSQFSETKVRIRYLNRGAMRVKPNVMGYVFNKDGVILGSFEDSWLFSSLAPGEREEVSVSISFQVPDEFVFSRWATCVYDEKPAWFLFAASSKQFDELVERSASRLRALKAKSAWGG